LKNGLQILKQLCYVPKKKDVSPLNFSELLFYAFVKAAKLYIPVVASSLNPVVNGLHSKK